MNILRVIITSVVSQQIQKKQLKRLKQFFHHCQQSLSSTAHVNSAFSPNKRILTARMNLRLFFKDPLLLVLGLLSLV